MIIRSFFVLVSLSSLSSKIFSFAEYDSYEHYRYGFNHYNYNYFGINGYLSMPSANISQPGVINFATSSGDLFKFGSITFSLTERFQGSVNYVSIQDTPYSNNNSYLDKGINFKLKLVNEGFFFPAISIGVNDLAGTGIFSSEYIVASKKLAFIDLSFGAITGSYASNKRWAFKNPFGGTRKGNTTLTGGTINVSDFFKGEISAFMGAEIRNPYIKNLRLILEYNPADFTNSVRSGFSNNPDLRKRKLNFDLGLRYSVSQNFDLNFSFERGKDFVIGFSFHPNLSKRQVKPIKPEPIIKNASQSSFYINLLQNLNNNQLFLQYADLSKDKEELTIGISQNKYLNHSELFEELDYILPELKPLPESIKIAHVEILNGPLSLGVYSYNINERESLLINGFNADTFVSKSNISRNISLKEHSSFRPSIKFPILSFNINPGIKHHLGAPEDFYNGALFLATNLNLQVNHNNFIAFKTTHHLIDSFDRLNRSAASQLPNVRSNIRKYLQSSDHYISRMQWHFMDHVNDNTFIKLTAGIYEEMFLGAGIELLRKEILSPYGVGFEIHKVQQRDYDMLLKTLNYSTWTYHINNYFKLPNNFELHISLGKYLARDSGYSIDIRKHFRNGLKMGGFFTRTNVSKELFGEGSFDKGIYFQIPLNVFINRPTTSLMNYRWRPLTRDGGQRLEDQTSLWGYVENDLSRYFDD